MKRENKNSETGQLKSCLHYFMRRVNIREGIITIATGKIPVLETLLGRVGDYWSWGNILELGH